MTDQSGDTPGGLEKFSDFISEPQGVLPPIQGFEDQPLVSLEEAIKPLKSLIPSIDHMVWTVTNDIVEIKDGLTKDESASIRLYTLEWSGKSFYKILNDNLRLRDRKKLIPWFLYLRLLVHALSRLPSNSHRVIYRGVQLDFSAEYTEGKKFFWWAFSSCTSSLSVLESFIGTTGPRTIFNITFHSAIDITQHSYHADEKEVLFYPARQFKVNSRLNAGNGLHIIHVEEIECPFPLFHMPRKPIPNPTPSPIDQFINILFIGEKGVGKATFINAFVNYLSFPKVEQARKGQPIIVKPLAFRTLLNDTFEERLCTFGNAPAPDASSTAQCQTYTFDPRLNDGKILHLIDTPSLEDTSQSNPTNTTTIQHILNYVNQLSHLNAVCFLLQPDASQLSTTFRACFSQVINRLGPTVHDNVVFCFTNALMSRGKKRIFSDLKSRKIPKNPEKSRKIPENPKIH